jgi:transposase
VESGALAGNQKKARREGYKLLFVDESAFYLLPGMVRTWAPKGETPTLKVPLTRNHYSVISAISPEGELYLSMQEKAFDSAAVIRFLEELLARIPGKLLIIWDGAAVHRSKPLRAFLSQGGAKRIHLERLPGYAPELNPDEGVWHYLKHVEMGNVCAQDMQDLREKLQQAYRRLKAKPEIIKAFFAQAGLSTHEKPT